MVEESNWWLFERTGTLFFSINDRLFDYVNKNTELSMPEQDGKSKFEHLSFIEKTTGKKPQELQDLPVVPLAGQYIIDIFYNLNNSRQFNDSGPCKLSLFEIKNWSDLYNVELSPFEIDTIQRLDNCFINTVNNCKK